MCSSVCSADSTVIFFLGRNHLLRAAAGRTGSRLLARSVLLTADVSSKEVELFILPEMA